MPFWWFPRNLDIRVVIGRPTQSGFEQRGIDHAAGAGKVAAVQGGQNTNGAPHARSHVDHGNSRPDRRLPIFAGHRHDAAKGLHQGIEARPLRQRAGGAKSPQVAIYQFRFEGPHMGRPQAQTIRHPGAQVLQDHIRFIRNAPAQFGQGGGVLVIDRDRTFISVDDLENRCRLAPERRAPAAHRRRYRAAPP